MKTYLLGLLWRYMGKYNKNHKKSWTLEDLKRLKTLAGMKYEWRIIALKLARTESACKTAFYNYSLYKRRFYMKYKTKRTS